MKKTLASIVAGISLFASGLAFGEDLKIGDKMPEPRGKLLNGGIYEYIHIKDTPIQKYIGTDIIPHASSKSFLKTYYIPNPDATLFDFQIEIPYPDSDKVFKRIVLISDREKPGQFSLYASCSESKEIDVIKKNFESNIYNFVYSVNVPELSCTRIMISDFWANRNKKEQNATYVAKE